jgi:hypothetical protein
MPLTSVNDYQIDYEIRPEYLLVRVLLHTNNYNIARQYWTDLVRLAHERRYQRAIVEISAPNPLPPKDSLSLMSDFSKRIAPDVKVAVVNTHVAEMVRSAVSSSAMIHGRSLKVFDSIESAEAWLKEDDAFGAEPSARIHNQAPDLSFQDLTIREMM